MIFMENITINIISREKKVFTNYLFLAFITGFLGLLINSFVFDIELLYYIFIFFVMTSMLLIKITDSIVVSGKIVLTEKEIKIFNNTFPLFEIENLKMSIQEYEGRKSLGNLISFFAEDGTDNSIEFIHHNIKYKFQVFITLNDQKKIINFLKFYKNEINNMRR